MFNRLCIVLLLFVITISFSVADEDNLIKNPGFEEVVTLDKRDMHRMVVSRGWNLHGKLYPENWSIYWGAKGKSFLTIDEENPHSGKYYVKIWGTPGWKKNLKTFYTQKMKITSPVEISASIWARGKGEIMMTFYTYGLRNKSVPFGQRRKFKLTSEWKKYQVTFDVLKENIENVCLVLDHYPTVENSVFYYDDASLEITGW